MPQPPDLPPPIRSALEPLLQALPITNAMAALVPNNGANHQLTKLVEVAIADRAISKKPELAAGLWLYIDELQRSHEISQRIPTTTGAFWHAIMHRREGDFGNARYWLNQTGRHPAMELIENYEPYEFLEEVSKRHRSNPQDLVQMQRDEWAALFSWCAWR